MRKTLLSMAALPLMVGALSVSASANGISVLDNVKVKGEIRPRAEVVSVDDTKSHGEAYTARTHLVATAGLLGVDGLSATVGIQSVNNFGSTNYFSTNNGAIKKAKYDIIVDPQFAMLSEASLDYKTGKTALHAGRSHVNLDNQRFIGTVGWRQNERSYDTLYVANSDVKNLNLLAAYVYGFQGVKANPTADTASILLHANYTVSKALKITAYDYMLASISDTMGIAFTGKVDAGAKLTYRAEYAQQSDPSMEYKTKNVKADADYYNLDLGANISGVLAGVNYEVLSGADGSGKTAFNPALGTNHKFNGWADVFYVASHPTMGLEDANIRLGYKAKGFGKFLAVYHNFTAENAAAGQSDDLGSEIDAVYVNKIPGVNGLKGLVKYASFSKGDATNGYAASQKDKQVAWLMLDYKFATK